MMYETIQWFHIVVFSFLMVCPGWRLTSAVLVLSAFLYIGMEPRFDKWNDYSNINGYLFRASVDAIAANICLTFGGKSGRVQASILAFGSLVHIVAALEFYTQYELMYNYWVSITRFLNVLQLLVAYGGCIQLIEYLKERVDSNNRGDWSGVSGLDYGRVRHGKEN